MIVQVFFPNTLELERSILIEAAAISAEVLRHAVMGMINRTREGEHLGGVIFRP